MTFGRKPNVSHQHLMVNTHVKHFTLVYFSYTKIFKDIFTPCIWHSFVNLSTKELGFFLYCFIVCGRNTVVDVPVDAKRHCSLLPSCDGIECCIDNAFYLGNRSVNFKLRLDCTDLEFHIESKKIVKSLSSLSDSKINTPCHCYAFYQHM